MYTSRAVVHVGKRKIAAGGWCRRKNVGVPTFPLNAVVHIGIGTTRWAAVARDAAERVPFVPLPRVCASAGMIEDSGPPPRELRRASEWRAREGGGGENRRPYPGGTGVGRPDLVGVDSEHREERAGRGRSTGRRSSVGKLRNGTIGHTRGGGYPPCFCVCRGNKGVTGEWRVSMGNKGVSGRKSEEVANGEGVGRVVCVPDDVPGRSEMARQPGPRCLCPGQFCGTLSITGEA